MRAAWMPYSGSCWSARELLGDDPRRPEVDVTIDMGLDDLTDVRAGRQGAG